MNVIFSMGMKKKGEKIYFEYLTEICISDHHIFCTGLQETTCAGTGEAKIKQNKTGNFSDVTLAKELRQSVG